MYGLRAITADHLPRPLRAAWWRSVGAIGLSRAARYLRGLTVVRVGLVLLICVIFTVRQQGPCIFQIVCGLADAGTLAGFAYFLARQFLFALPMLFAVTIVDNVTTRSGQRVRALALSAAVLLGAIVYGLAFLHTS